MSARFDGANEAPYCWCKVGKMVVKVAGPKSPNFKRLYYKCPDNRDDHPKHFIWVDEHRDRSNFSDARDAPSVTRMRTQSHETPTASSRGSPVCDNAVVRPRTGVNIADVDQQFTMTFMCVSLVMLGVIIGLVLAKMI